MYGGNYNWNGQPANFAPQYGGYGQQPQPGYSPNNSYYCGVSPVAASPPAFGPGLAMPQPQVMGQAVGGLGICSTPSLKPHPGANPQQDAEFLRKAMRGFFCNNSKVIQVLCTRTHAQRQQIAVAFGQMYRRNLFLDLKRELHGHFEQLILALMEYPPKYDADQLHKAMEGIGTRESVLVEVLTTRTNAQVHQLRLTYQQLYQRDLERDIVGDTSGHFKRLLLLLCRGQRDESGLTDRGRAGRDARMLYRAGEGRLGTDESKFNMVLASQNFAQLRLVFDEYQRLCGHSIEQAIVAEFSGDIRQALLAIGMVVRNRAAFFAARLRESMRGLGTRDNDLIRVVVTRSEIDLADIRAEYQRMFGVPLEAAIRSDCSGPYKGALITLVHGN